MYSAYIIWRIHLIFKKYIFQVGTCDAHLATWEAEIWRIAIQGQPGQKTCEIPSQQEKAGHGGNVPITPGTPVGSKSRQA
jgi:hypothetical protein